MKKRKRWKKRERERGNLNMFSRNLTETLRMVII